MQLSIQNTADEGFRLTNWVVNGFKLLGADLTTFRLLPKPGINALTGPLAPPKGPYVSSIGPASASLKASLQMQ